jgi:hypothetical protein
MTDPNRETQPAKNTAGPVAARADLTDGRIRRPVRASRRRGSTLPRGALLAERREVQLTASILDLLAPELPLARAECVRPFVESGDDQRFLVGREILGIHPLPRPGCDVESVVPQNGAETDAMSPPIGSSTNGAQREGRSQEDTHSPVIDLDGLIEPWDQTTAPADNGQRQPLLLKSIDCLASTPRTLAAPRHAVLNGG